jgi:tetratricopeptide (TPR) repeat protein
VCRNIVMSKRMLFRNFESFRENILNEINLLDQSLVAAPIASCRDGRAWQNRRKRKLIDDLQETERRNQEECLFEDDRKRLKAAATEKERGDEKAEVKELDEAITNYDTAAQLVEQIPSARGFYVLCNSHCATISSTMENYDAIIKYGTRVLSRDPDNYEILAKRAMAYINCDQPKEALQDLNKVHLLDPGEPSIPLLIQKMRKRIMTKSVIDTIILGLLEKDDPLTSGGIRSNHTHSMVHGSKPRLQLNENSDFCIALFGCREEFEGRVDFLQLHDELLRYFDFEGGGQLKEINVTLVGTKLIETDVALGYDAVLGRAKVRVRQVPSPLEKFHLAGSWDYQYAILCNPELSTSFVAWSPLLEKLLSKRILTMTTGYSNNHRWSVDAILDEKILHDFFFANIIRYRRRNTKNLFHKMSYYLSFQGRHAQAQTDDPLMEGEPSSSSAASPADRYNLHRDDMIKNIRIFYLQYQGDEAVHLDCNTSFGTMCFNVASALSDGSLRTGHYLIPHDVTLLQLRERVPRLSTKSNSWI